MSEKALEPITSDFLVDASSGSGELPFLNSFEDSRVLPGSRLHPKTVIPYLNMS